VRLMCRRKLQVGLFCLVLVGAALTAVWSIAMRSSPITSSPQSWKSLEGTTVTVRGKPMMDGSNALLQLDDKRVIYVREVAWTKEQLTVDKLTLAGLVDAPVYITPGVDGKTLYRFERPDRVGDGGPIATAYGILPTLRILRIE
jgi:hypothetical protein